MFTVLTFGDNVEDIFKNTAKPELLTSAQRMFARAIGEDEFAAGQSGNRFCEPLIGKQTRPVDIMHEAEKLLGADIELFHQTIQRRAMLLVIIFLQRAG